MKFSALLLIALCLPACSTILVEPPETAQSISSPLPKTEEVKSTKTLGSLWSGNSSWNSLYSATASRTEGDLLEISLGGQAKNRIEAMRKKILKEKYGDENYEKPTKKDEGLIGGESSAEAPKKIASDPLPSTLQAVIKSVGQRGLYEIAALETIKVGEEDSRLILEGLVRDRDIDAGDKFSSDAIYGLKVELRPLSAQAPAPVQANKVISAGGNSNVSW
jgi:flagellar basal body L-ring protein FlgH